MNENLKELSDERKFEWRADRKRLSESSKEVWMNGRDINDQKSLTDKTEKLWMNDQRNSEWRTDKEKCLHERSKEVWMNDR